LLLRREKNRGKQMTKVSADPMADEMGALCSISVPPDPVPAYGGNGHHDTTSAQNSTGSAL
jgi:hypothetical protein